jgi:hypothetical protein
LDGRCPALASQDCDLAKVCSRVQRVDEVLLPLFVPHEALALALCNNVEVVSLFALMDLDFLRLSHHKLDLLDDKLLNVFTFKN